jgi:DNA mismatch endonuclease, patch repair protein
MIDIVTPAVRSRMMSTVRSKNTKGELVLRKRLTALGYHYRLHRRDLPGTPDLVFPGRRAVIFFHGCFWHWHGCSLFRMPSSNAAFWAQKLMRNVDCDARAKRKLIRSGWRVLEVWECAIRGAREEEIDGVVAKIDGWLQNGKSSRQLPFARKVATRSKR